MSGRQVIGYLVCLVILACSPASDKAPETRATTSSEPVVIAANYPLFFFAEQIAGDSVTVAIPDFDGDPAFWKPDSHEVQALQQADLLLLNGAGYESWRGWVTLPQDSPLDTSQDFRERLVFMDDLALHQHGPGGEHSHGDLAFTTWLDPTLAAGQAEAVARGLSFRWPQYTAVFRERLNGLLDRMQDLDAQLETALANLGGQPILFSHPVYQYLERRYELNGISLHWEPDAEPSTGDWIELQRMLKRHPARLMIWEDFPLEATASRLRELGVEPVVFQTLALPPPSGDYFDGMEANIGRLPRR